MDKRRFITQIPVIHQTDALKKFFGSTIDHLFQPGVAEQVSGYIGQKPSYTNTEKDFYVAEPDVVRAEHQLEPAMITTDPDTAEITRLFFYDDLINYMRSVKGKTNDHNRLFDSDRYSWCPPVDPDKFLNFSQYRWFGDDPDSLPFIELTAPSKITTANGITATFPLPNRLEHALDSQVEYMAFVNGLRVKLASSTDTTVTLDAVPANNSVVEVFRYGDLRRLITGLVSANVSEINTKGITTLMNDMRIKLVDGVLKEAQYDVAPLDLIPNGNPDGQWGNPDWDSTEYDNGVRTIPWDYPEVQNDYIVGNVGKSIVLVPYDIKPELAVDQPIHVLINRCSADKNPWSLVNYWIHCKSLEWTGERFLSLEGKRPILEFLSNIELWNYGTTRLKDVVAIVTDGKVMQSPTPLISVPALYDTGSYTSIGVDEIEGKTPGTIFLPGWRILRPGDRILVTNHDRATFKNRIYTIGTRKVETSTQTRLVLTLISFREAREYDIVRLRNRGPDAYDKSAMDGAAWEFDMDGAEYHFNGTDWVEAQKYGDGDPLFALYTDAGDRHDKLSKSTFAGNRLIGFAEGSSSTKPDAVLNRALKYDSFDEIVFENDQVTRQTTFSDGSLVPGYQYCRILGAIEPGITIDTGEMSIDVSNVNISRDDLGFRIEPDKYLNGWLPQGEWQKIIDGIDAIDANGVRADLKFVPNRPQQTQGSNSVWSMPNCFVANPDHDQPTFLSRCQWFDHLVSLLDAQTGFSGHSIAENNWFTISHDFSLGNRIVDHRWPLLKTMLLASDSMFDLPDGMRYVEQEYLRFRSKFIRQIIEIQQTSTLTADDDPDLWVDAALNALIVAKSKDSPFYLSSVAGGGWYIPPTPATLGIVPPVAPGYVYDDTYSQTVKLLRGHDGSLTLPFGDIRDAALLALEQRIWQNIPTTLRTATPVVDMYDIIPGRYRTTRFTRSEINDMLASHFRRWVSFSGFDFQKYEGYDSTNPFTWNYNGITDRNGETMPGSWRAIYRWYFDTDSPHKKPWEMLGFKFKPAWWDAEYGAAPYKRTNSKLWTDIQDGRIANGPRKGVDTRFARPDLMTVLPVDNDGKLLNPMAANIIPRQPTQEQASKYWKIGDHGPIENLWLMNPAYGFALAQMAFSARPAQFVEEGWDTLNREVRSDGQFVHSTAKRRQKCADLVVHGELDDNNVPQPVLGIQQFVVEHMIFRAQDPAIFGKAVRGLGVRLGHRMAGFTSSDNLRVFADNFGLIPQEDVKVILHKSPPTKEAIYSGIIIEWTGDRWRIIGYDEWGSNTIIEEIRTPGYDTSSDWTHSTITIIPPDRASTRRTMRLGEDLVINEWRSNVFYQVNTVVEYEQSIYRCIRSHTSNTKFDDTYWKPDANARKSQTISVILYDHGEDRVEHVENGTTYTHIQEVVDFLTSYERWLIKAGFVFDVIDPLTGFVLDWTNAIQEFLLWAQMHWEPGAFIALSPGASELKYRTPQGYVLNMEGWDNGFYGLVDRTGRPIPRTNTFITRLDEETKIVTSSEDLFGARLRIGEIEHALVFSNETIFNDIIYQPLYDLRQPRLRLIGQRTTPWAGRLDAPGYMVDEDNLLPNFERASEDIREMFEVDKADRKVLRNHARHVSGYQTRSYLDDLLISETQQFEFYQGMIQQKGAPGVFSKLARSEFIEQQRDLRFLDEWAIQMSRYGAVGLHNEVAFKLYREDIRHHPQLIEFSEDNIYDTTVGVPLDSDRWIVKPATEKVFTNTNAVVDDGSLPEYAPLPTAGHVRLDEIDYTAFHAYHLNSLYLALVNEGRAFSDGDRIWVYDYELKGWNVLRATRIGLTDAGANAMLQIETPSENETLDSASIRVYFSVFDENLTVDAVGKYAILQNATNTTPDYSGCHKITNIFYGCGAEDCDNNIDLDASEWLSASTSPVGINYTTSTTATAPEMFILYSMRFATRAAVDAFHALHPFDVGELVYVDAENINDENRWVVLRRTSSGWENYRVEPQKLDTGRIESALIHGTNTKITNRTLSPEPLVLDALVPIDPVLGLIPGVAEREITYKLESDPAVYIGQGRWGSKQVGQLWWNLNTIRYLETELDDLDIDSTIFVDNTLVYLDNTNRHIGNQISALGVSRRKREMEYRTRYFGRLAPGSSVDIYEWTRSTANPAKVDGALTDTVIIVDEFDEATAQMIVVYYYWLRNPTTTPNLPDRHMSAQQIANVLSNITGSDIPWMAPVSRTALLVGGIEQHLAHDTVLRIRQNDILRDDAVVHEEWSLVRQNDERGALPADWLWVAIRNSLVGHDVNDKPVPDQTLAPHEQVGLSIKPRKSVFAPRDTETIREAMLNARRSYVTIVNKQLAAMNITIDYPSAISALTPVSYLPAKNLIWSRPDDQTRIDYPPPSSYDIRVETIDERDALIHTSTWKKMINNIRNGVAVDRPRVMIDNYRADRPSWSIWTLADDETIIELQKSELTNPEKVFKVATVYDKVVSNRAALDTLNTTIGTRVLVRADEGLGGFWSIWQKADVGYTFETAQRSKLQDFWEYADWYEDGYSAVNPPIVKYATIVDRAKANVAQEEYTFVRVDNDGSGKWIWCEYVDGTWKTVARQNSTIQLSKKFYDSSTVAGWGIDRFDDPTTRDGSFELCAIFDILKDTVFSDIQNIDVFFDILNYVHSQQDHVGWAFKTSFLSVAGYNTRLNQTPVQVVDNTENMLDYIEEVKPYRVKTRTVIQSMSPDIDQMNLDMTDFDNPPYYDTAKKVFRTLDPSDATDLEILKTLPWSHWLSKASVDMENSPIRHFSMTMKFDRCSSSVDNVGWDATSGFNTPWSALDEAVTAIDRLEVSYQPTAKMPTTAQAMGLLFKGDLELDGGTLATLNADIKLDGGTFTMLGDPDWLINPTVPGLRDPHHAENRPEEMVATAIGDAMSICIKRDWNIGAPLQSTVSVSFDKKDREVYVPFSTVPQSLDAIAVFIDGHRLPTDMYVVDGFNGVTVPILEEVSGTVVVHTYGVSGLTKMREQKLYDANDQRTYTLDFEPTGYVEVLVDGVHVPASKISISGTTVTLNNSVVGDAVMINSWEPGQTANASYASTVYHDMLPLEESTESNDTHIWDLPHRTLQIQPEYIGTICEVNGSRLMPPKTYYGVLDGDYRYVELYQKWSEDDMSLWLNGTKITPKIVRCADDADVDTMINGWGNMSYDKSLPFEIDDVRWVLVGTRLWCLNPSILGEVIVSVNADCDYTVEDGKLIMFKSIFDSGYDILGWGGTKMWYDSYTDSLATIDLRTDVTTFRNASLLGLRTYTFSGEADGEYRLVAMPASPDHIMVTRNGLLQKYGEDYCLEHKMINTKRVPFLKIRNARYEQRIVVMIFSGVPAMPPSYITGRTTASGPSRMGNLLGGGNYDYGMFDVGDGYYFDTPVSNVDLVKAGINASYDLKGGWEWSVHSEAGIGGLVNDLKQSDSSFTINLNPRNTSADRLTVLPFTLPDIRTGEPGVVWVDGERIEFTDYDVLENNQITFGGLRRHTRGTHTACEQANISISAGSGVKKRFPFAFSSNDIEVTLVKSNGVKVGQILGVDFSIEIKTNGERTIVMMKAPTATEKLILRETLEAKHLAGTRVYGDRVKKDSITRVFCGE